MEEKKIEKPYELLECAERAKDTEAAAAIIYEDEKGCLAKLIGKKYTTYPLDAITWNPPIEAVIERVTALEEKKENLTITDEELKELKYILNPYTNRIDESETGIYK